MVISISLDIEITGLSKRLAPISSTMAVIILDESFQSALALQKVIPLPSTYQRAVHHQNHDTNRQCGPYDTNNLTFQSDRDMCPV